MNGSKSSRGKSINEKVKPVLVQLLLEKEGIHIPLSLLKHKTILEIENSIRKGKPIYLSNYFRKMSQNIEEYIEINKIEDFINFLREIKSDPRFYITPDDEKIILRLIKVSKEKPSLNYLNLEIVGPTYFVLNVLKEMEENRKISNILKMFVIIHSYLILYEVLLHHIDRILYFTSEFRRVGDNKIIKDFENVKREEYHKHATAGLINIILSKILGLPTENNSIFGGKREAKILRNAIAHGSIFYDEKRNIIVIGTQTYTPQDFIKIYYRLFTFLITWIEKSLTEETRDTKKFTEIITKRLREIFSELSRTLLKMERFPERKLWYANLILSLKKEAKINE